MIGLGDFPGGDFRSWAFGVSADGSVLVGYGETSVGWEAFRWTHEAGMAGLGRLADSPYSLGSDVSDDGSVVVGRSQPFAFRWTAEGGMVPLGDLGGGRDYSHAAAVSGDGRWVVGQSETDLGNEAFIWDERNGMRRVAEVLGSHHINLEGWALEGATGVTIRGGEIIVVGIGKNPRRRYGRVDCEFGSCAGTARVGACSLCADRWSVVGCP